MVQRKLKRNVWIGVEARDRQQCELEGPLLARLVERHNVRQLVRDHVFDPIVTAAQFKVEASGPNGHGIAVVVGPAVAQHIGVVEDDDVDGAEVVVVIVGRRESGKDFLAGFGYSARGTLGSKHVMDPEVIGDDGFYLGLGRSGEEQRGNGGKNRSAQRVSLSQKGDPQPIAGRSTICVGKYWRPCPPSNNAEPLSRGFAVNYYTSMHYTIHRTDDLDLPDADWERPQWQAAETLEITHFPWEDSGHRPRTQARLLYDERALSIIFRVEDRYVRAVAERFQDSVCTDSCVEFFVAPYPTRRLTSISRSTAAAPCSCTAARQPPSAPKVASN